MKGYSLHVGVGFVGGVENSKYGYHDLKLKGAENDAKKMREIIKSSKPETDDICLLSSENTATSVRFFESMTEIIEKTEKNNEESFVLLTFSGHGTEYTDIQHGVQQVEFLCFQDRMVLEHEIKIMLLKLPKRVKCCVIIDSCFAAGISNDLGLEGFDKDKNDRIRIHIKPNTKSISADERDSIIRNHEIYYHDLIQTTPRVSGNRYRAEICFMSACQIGYETADSMIEGKTSSFTTALILALADANYESNYNSFYLNVSKKLNYPEQGGPVIKGAYSSFFQNNAPFTY